MSILGWDLSLVPYFLGFGVLCLGVGWYARELRDWLATRP